MKAQFSNARRTETAYRNRDINKMHKSMPRIYYLLYKRETGVFPQIFMLKKSEFYI